MILKLNNQSITMFWGLVMNPNKWYTQVVEIPFHVSMATLDITTANDELVQVMLSYSHKNYHLCNLQKDSVWQVPLDLNFQKGSKITLICSGQSHVHLTGYFKYDEDCYLDVQEAEEDDENKDSEKEHEEEENDDNDDDDIKMKERSSKQAEKYKVMQQQRNKQKKKKNKQKLIIAQTKENNKEKNKK